jgi:hypothetical protein
MRGGAHRQRGAVRWFAVVLSILVLGALGAGAWWFFLREGAPIDLGEPDHPVAEFSFELSKVNGSGPGGDVPGGEVEGAAEGIRETLDAVYVAGYVDPSKWEGGSFPEVLEQFDDGAAERASSDLAFLTLGGEATRVDFVEPEVGTLRIRVLLDADAQPAGAVATARFVADGEFKDGKPLFVINDGTYYLRPDGDRWLISGYDVHGVVQPGQRPTGPQAAPTAGSSP